MFLGIVFFLGIVALRNYFILQTTGGMSPSPSPSSTSVSSFGETSSSQTVPQIPQTQISSQGSVENGQFQSGSTVDPSTQDHMLPSGGRADIKQVGDITVSQQQAYTGDDITFTVTIKNQAGYKKFMRQLCFQSNEGNFGCSPGFNLDPGEVLSISNNGRFTSQGTKTIWVSWTQDGTNYYTPVGSRVVTVQIL